MNEYKYLVTNRCDRFIFEETKKEANETAITTLEHADDINYVYKIQQVAECYYPDPTPVIEWD